LLEHIVCSIHSEIFEYLALQKRGPGGRAGRRTARVGSLGESRADIGSLACELEAAAAAAAAAHRPGAGRPAAAAARGRAAAADSELEVASARRTARRRRRPAAARRGAGGAELSGY